MLLKGFSIIVCCYNSAPLLPATILHLSKLKQPDTYGVEIVLVDNCSTDDTAATARSLWEGFGQPFAMTVVEEPVAGLSFARQRGIADSRYDYLLFCDDDNWLDPEYLIRAAEVLESIPMIGVLGGLGTPHYEHIPSYWPPNFYIYGSGPQAPESGPTAKLHGAGVILVKKAFDRLRLAQFRFCLTDRKGDSLSSGGDYELCYAVAMAGFRIWYDQNLVFSHFISRDRLTPAYTRRFVRESAPAVDVLDIYHHLRRRDKNASLTYTLLQVKYLLHHLRRLGHSTYLRIRYRRDDKMVFLETFHQQYHLRRFVCILKTLPRHRKMMRAIRSFGERLAQLPADNEQDGRSGI